MLNMKYEPTTHDRLVLIAVWVTVIGGFLSGIRQAVH